MPDGKIHDEISLITTPVIAGLVWFVFGNTESLVIITVSYIFASFMFNGDLDIVSKPYNRWWLFKIIWVPYQMMFKHRSIFTHGIIIGTLVRILYLGLLPFLYFQFIRDIDLIKYIISPESLYILLGLELGNTMHTLADKTL